MRERKVRLELDPALEGIEVLIRAPEENGEVSALLELLGASPSDTVTVFDGNGLIRALAADQIVSASVDGKLVNIVTEGGSWYTRRTLQSLEDALDKRRFLRVSRYEIVNLTKVRRYDFTVAGTLRLELAGGMETWASRRCIPEIRRRLKGKG